MAINLKTLSEGLGLSQTTVSRALNGYSDVAESTRARVQAEAERLNYQPNSRAKELATGRSMVIGHVIPTATKHEMVNPIFGDFIAGALEAYATYGYRMLLVRAQPGDEENSYRDLAATRAVDGVIIQGPSINDKRISLLQDIGIPFVVHGRSSGIKAPYPWVDVNNKRAFSRATKFLLDLGHQRIGLINGLEAMDFAQRRRQGYLEALSDAGIKLDAKIMTQNEMTEPIGYREATRMLTSPNAPTAFLVSSLISALGVRRAIDDAGLKLGKDVSVTIHDDAVSYLPNGSDVPVFTATRSSVAEAGRIAAEVLIEQILSPETPIKTQLLEAELVLGSSTGPVIKAA